MDRQQDLDIGIVEWGPVRSYWVDSQRHAVQDTKPRPDVAPPVSGKKVPKALPRGSKSDFILRDHQSNLQSLVGESENESDASTELNFRLSDREPRFPEDVLNHREFYLLPKSGYGEGFCLSTNTSGDSKFGTVDMFVQGRKWHVTKIQTEADPNRSSEPTRYVRVFQHSSEQMPEGKPIELRATDIASIEEAITIISLGDNSNTSDAGMRGLEARGTYRDIKQKQNGKTSKLGKAKDKSRSSDRGAFDDLRIAADGRLQTIYLSSPSLIEADSPHPSKSDTSRHLVKVFALDDEETRVARIRGEAYVVRGIFYGNFKNSPDYLHAMNEMWSRCTLELSNGMTIPATKADGDLNATGPKLYVKYVHGSSGSPGMGLQANFHDKASANTPYHSIEIHLCFCKDLPENPSTSEDWKKYCEPVRFTPGKQAYHLCRSGNAICDGINFSPKIEKRMGQEGRKMVEGLMALFQSKAKIAVINRVVSDK